MYGDAAKQHPPVDGALAEQLEQLQTQTARLEYEICLNAFRVEAMLQLSRMTEASLREVTEYALEQAVQLTQSVVGYLAFVNEAETELTMHAWSLQAMAECRVHDRPIVYPLEKTGLWGEAVRQRRPVITNDYAAPSPHKKGLPTGHVTIQRHMNVPVFDGHKIVAVAGVGNKEEPYSEWDARQLTLLMESMWSIIRRHRYEEELRRHRDDLEALVQARTVQLQDANRSLESTNTKLLEEVRQREAAEIEIRRQHDRIQLSEARLRAITDAAMSAIVMIDGQGRVTYWNPAAERIFGHTAEEILGRDVHTVLAPPELRGPAGRGLAGYFRSGEGRALGKVLEMEALHKGGRRFPIEIAVAPLRTEDQWCAVAVMYDISQRNRLKRELAESQKLEAVGRLAAGVAHEINTPIQYTADNLRFLGEHFPPLLDTADALREMIEAAQTGNIPPALLERASTSLASADPEFLAAEIPPAISQALSGMESVTAIVAAMREFSGPSNQEKQAADLGQVIESTLAVCRNKWKDVARIDTEFDPSLPWVPIRRGEFGQAMLQLVVNAAQAITRAGPQSSGQITISTRRDGTWAEIRISDTGREIPVSLRDTIFEPLVSEGAAGVGFRQGLAMARSIVVDRHRGTISLEASDGAGTTFTVRLPLDEETAATPVLDSTPVSVAP